MSEPEVIVESEYSRRESEVKNLDDRTRRVILEGEDQNSFNLRVNGQEVCFPKYEDAVKESERIYEFLDSYNDPRSSELDDFVKVLLEAYKYAEQFYERKSIEIVRANERSYERINHAMRVQDKCESLITNLATMVDATQLVKVGFDKEAIKKLANEMKNLDGTDMFKMEAPNAFQALAGQLEEDKQTKEEK